VRLTGVVGGIGMRHRANHRQMMHLLSKLRQRFCKPYTGNARGNGCVLAANFGSFKAQ
jgi:hypothetical protein